MIYWAPLLHFYQPPTQSHRVLSKVCEESYRPLVELFTGLPHAKVTININAVLTEMLSDHGFNDVLLGLAELAKRGQVEFTGSGKYHPILPLIPPAEMERQISQNLKTNRRLLGKVYEPEGFFPPEMCYSREILKPVLAAGHQWIIVSGIACPMEWPVNVIHQIDFNGSSISVFFRDNILSNKISFHNIDARGFIEQLKQIHKSRKVKGDIYVITAMDAETFGHHIRDWEKLFLAEVFNSLKKDARETADRDSKPPVKSAGLEKHKASNAAEAVQIRAVRISELLEIFPAGSTIDPAASSWSTESDDIEAGNPFPLWNHQYNIVHQYQWEHLGIAISMVDKAMEESRTKAARNHAGIARELLDAALHSCQFWWASKAPMWNANMIHRGLNLQQEAILNAYRAINISDCSHQVNREYYYKLTASRELANKITDRIFIEPD